MRVDSRLPTFQYQPSNNTSFYLSQLCENQKNYGVNYINLFAQQLHKNLLDDILNLFINSSSIMQEVKVLKF